MNGRGVSLAVGKYVVNPDFTLRSYQTAVVDSSETQTRDDLTGLNECSWIPDLDRRRIGYFDPTTPWNRVGGLEREGIKCLQFKVKFDLMQAYLGRVKQSNLVILNLKALNRCVVGHHPVVFRGPVSVEVTAFDH